MNNITWTCHICKRERPDRFISVLTKPLDIPGVDASQNIRYCNDNTQCLNGAQTFSFLEDSEAER